MRTALRSRPIRTLAITQFLLEVQFWFPIWLIYLLDLGFPLATAVLADGAFRIVSVICEFPVGLVADRVGRRATYLALAGATVLTFTVITQIRSVQVLFGAWVLWGVLWALSSGAASTYLYELCAQDPLDIDPARAIGLVRAVGNVSVLVSLLAAGYLYDVDHRLPFAVTAVLAAVAFLLAYTLPEIAGSRVVATLSSVLADIRGAAADPRVRRAVRLGALLLLFGWSARILFQPLALHLGLSAQVTGWMYGVFAAASALGGLVAGYVRPAYRAGALSAAFLLILAALVATNQMDRLGPFLFLPIMGFGYTLGLTVLEVFTNEVTPRAVRATIFGVIACVGGVGIAVARPGLGMLAERHSTTFAFGIWAGIGVLLIGLAVPGIRRIRVAARPAADR
ncbi:Predicted arabinose efflux permease, MFS family [Micromonospora coriariae]|uniref:Predicted arabinose efflux permease, MFS family n=1 Tax=Micromonospora coriariae TaxID=285665 RepID=A0A1C4WKJ3_9ACTN|nr:MFS transporter [Micromonospora coriariae]SCE96653.1 Predicted arabinose efflux permease, MFS family [Micromonospora coriariae]